MLRFLGIALLVSGSIGLGLSARDRLKNNLEVLYQIRQIFKMFQNEITYSRAPLPEACRRIGMRMEEPYRNAFLMIHEEMLENNGKSFTVIWKKHMEKCLKEIPVSQEDKKIFLDFGNCIGFADGEMQAEAMEQYMHKINISVERLEKDMVNKCKVIMSLSVMGGLMIAVILI